MKTVTIIDYGMSNLLSIARAIEKVGASVSVTDDAELISKAEILVLPGVGAFYDGINELKKRNIPEAINDFLNKGNPFLGICLGMQMMLSKGTEIETTDGLNIIPGVVNALPEFNSDQTTNIIPHIGWATVHPSGEQSIFNNLGNPLYMYFVHSYCAHVESPEHSAATSPFGDVNFTSIIHKDNAWGTQFHPEKSGEAGLQLLKNILTL